MTCKSTNRVSKNGAEIKGQGRLTIRGWVGYSKKNETPVMAAGTQKEMEQKAREVR